MAAGDLKATEKINLWNFPDPRWCVEEGQQPQDGHRDFRAESRDFSTRAINSEVAMPRASQMLNSESIVGDFLSFSSWLMYVRCRLAGNDNSSCAHLLSCAVPTHWAQWMPSYRRLKRNFPTTIFTPVTFPAFARISPTQVAGRPLSATTST